MKRASAILASAIGLCTPWAQAAAQVGATTDIITGVVVNLNGTPLAGVEIEAFSLELEIARTAVTDRNGRYTILFPDGGGQYRMTARLIGAYPQTAILVRQADEDRLVWDVQLQDMAFPLDPLIVTGEAARRPIQVPDRPAPGDAQVAFTPDMLASLPLDPQDLALLATLVPGAVVLDATDSTEAAYSVAGQRPDANTMTLDGMTFGAGQLPVEGLRNTRIVTSTYDVSRGRFSGGLMAATSRSGTNRVQGSLSYALRDDDLALDDADRTSFATGFTQHTLGGGIGGPLVRNRLFGYLSGTARIRRDPFASLTSATAADLERLGVAPDSVARLLAITDSIGATPATRYDGNQQNDQISGMLRLDYLVSNRHTLTVRADARDQGQEPARVGPTGLPETGGENLASGGGVMAALSSQLGRRVINELRLYASSNTRAAEPYWILPQGRVQVASQLDDGSVGINTLTIGGNPSLPSGATTKSLEASTELSWFPGAATHRWKIGGLFRAERTTDVNAQARWGIYTYNSLADLAAGSPSSFRRRLDPVERTASMVEYALYVGDAWMPSRSFQMTFGLRAEGTSVGPEPASNPELATRLGVRTELLPAEFDLSPRVGFTWQIGGRTLGRPPAFIVSGGAGKFRSPWSLAFVSRAEAGTGRPDDESLLECTGASVPLPDWNAFRNDPGAIPRACDGPPSSVPARAPTVTVFAPDYESPKAWRASLGVQHSLSTLLRLSAGFSYARGIAQYGFRDLNLDTDAGFALAAEGNRPVFVPASTIVPATGAVNSRFSRVDSTFGQVLQLASALESDTKQLTLSLGGVTRTGVVLRASYTWSQVRDQSSFGAGIGADRGANTTAGNPNVPDWGRSALERRHAFLATVSYPFGPSLDVTAIGRISSGAPFTPLVASDINGDGMANDRAFVFDPAALPGMAELLDNAPPRTRECLLRQRGKVAERNSCLGPWEGSLELQVNYRPGFLGLDHRVAVSLTTMNLLQGLDQLLHGGDGLKGWGLRARPDEELLYVTGFDPANRQYQYAVNQRFGATDPARTAFRQPFQIGIQVRATFGPDRARDALLALRGAGRGLGGRPGPARGAPGAAMADVREGPAGEGFLERFRSVLVNPAGLVLERADSLGLAPDQIARLAALRDSLRAVNDSLGALLRADIERAGTGDPRQLLERIRPRFQEALRNVRENLEAVRALLSPEQWERLPERLRTLGEAPRPSGPRRPPGNE